MDAKAARSKIGTRATLEHAGVSGRDVERLLGAGELRRIHRGSYVLEADWRAAFPEERHLMQVFAADALSRSTDAVVSHASAAVLWGLPLFRARPARVHISGSATSGTVTTDGAVARHRVDVPVGDRDVRHGIACTSLGRTVFDVVRGVSEETALACADAAFRLVAWDDHAGEYDLPADEALRFELGERIRRGTGARGIRRARRVVELADGRAQLPGESVSRLYLLRLGFAPPRLQVPVPAPSGRDYLVDFGLDDVRAWGEFDGTGKYTDPHLMKGVGYTALAREKEREDWIRATTQRPVVRWGMRHVDTAATLGTRLAAFHLHPTR